MLSRRKLYGIIASLSLALVLLAAAYNNYYHRTASAADVKALAARLDASVAEMRKLQADLDASAAAAARQLTDAREALLAQVARVEGRVQDHDQKISGGSVALAGLQRELEAKLLEPLQAVDELKSRECFGTKLAMSLCSVAVPVLKPTYVHGWVDVVADLNAVKTRVDSSEEQLHRSTPALRTDMDSKIQEARSMIMAQLQQELASMRTLVQSANLKAADAATQAANALEAAGAAAQSAAARPAAKPAAQAGARLARNEDRTTAAVPPTQRPAEAAAAAGVADAVDVGDAADAGDARDAGDAHAGEAGDAGDAGDADAGDAGDVAWHAAPPPPTADAGFPGAAEPVKRPSAGDLPAHFARPSFGQETEPADDPAGEDDGNGNGDGDGDGDGDGNVDGDGDGDGDGNVDGDGNADGDGDGNADGADGQDDFNGGDDGDGRPHPQPVFPEELEAANGPEAARAAAGRMALRGVH